MCFSATASFGAGIVLSVIGVATIKKVSHQSQYMFATIPLLFAVQQFSEGILWLTLPYPNLPFVQKASTIVFRIFAQIIWPIYVPIAILLLEKQKTRKNIQRVMVAIGLLVASNLAYYLYNFKVQAIINCYHITYLQSYPENFRVLGGILYGVATIVPTFFSHIRHIWMLGLTIFISYLVTAVFYENYLISV